jgi:signal transduction histidine kinase
LNLIENALRHGRPPIQVTAEGSYGRLRVTVRDHGPGISPANRPKIFARFFTTDRDHGGTGLGLAIVASIAQRYGGEVSFASGANGTAFTLVI